MCHSLKTNLLARVGGKLENSAVGGTAAYGERCRTACRRQLVREHLLSDRLGKCSEASGSRRHSGCLVLLWELLPVSATETAELWFRANGEKKQTYVRTVLHFTCTYTIYVYAPHSTEGCALKRAASTYGLLSLLVIIYTQLANSILGPRKYFAH